MTTTISQSFKSAASPPPVQGEVRQVNRGSGRVYVKNTKEAPSITRILSVINKPALPPWAAKQERILVSDTAADLFESMKITEPKMSRLAYVMALEKQVGVKKAYEKVLAKAGDIGTEIHAGIEWILRHEMGEAHQGPQVPPSCEEVKHAMNTFTAWQKEHDMKPLFLEKILWSDEHQCAGTTDWIALLDGCVVLGDWKSGKAIYPESFLQISCYIFMALEMKLISAPVKGCIVRLPKTATDPKAEIKMIEWEEVQHHFHNGFLPARALFDWQQSQQSQQKKGCKK